MHGTISHTSQSLPDVILCRSFTRPSTALAVIEGLGTRLALNHISLRTMRNKNWSRYYPLSVNTKPHRLHWSDQEMGLHACLYADA